MRYHLRTLVIALGWGPPTLAVVWLWPDEVVVAILIVTLFGLLIVPIWAGVRRAELSSSAVQKETLSVRAAAMFRFTIRELALLTLVVGLGLGCWLMWAHVGSEQRRGTKVIETGR